MSEQRLRGVRGATTAEANTPDAIYAATREMLAEVLRLNDVQLEDIASAFFTTTRDLNAAYPAAAARQLGWHQPALMCAHEMDVPGGVPMCIRVMIHVNTAMRQDQMVNVYLKGAESLRATVPPIR